MLGKQKQCRCKKVCYESKSEAESALAEVRQKRVRRGESKKEAIIYNCKYGYYHLTSQIMPKLTKIEPSCLADIYFVNFTPDVGFTPHIGKLETYDNYFSP